MIVRRPRGSNLMDVTCLAVLTAAEARWWNHQPVDNKVNQHVECVGHPALRTNELWIDTINVHGKVPSCREETHKAIAVP